MRNKSLVVPIIAVGFAFLVGNQAQATPETGFDFSQKATTVTIDTMSSDSPNVLNKKTLTCPTKGYIVATANALFQFNTNQDFAGTIAYSISINSTAFDDNHHHNVFGNYVNDFHVFPASIQRVDSCTKGQSVIYRFLATQGTFVFDTIARQPSLVVVFYRDIL